MIKVYARAGEEFEPTTCYMCTEDGVMTLEIAGRVYTMKLLLCMEHFEELQDVVAR